jgi:hypothetical protein
MAKAEVTFGELPFGFERAFNFGYSSWPTDKANNLRNHRNELNMTTDLGNKPRHYLATLRNADNHLSSHV